MKTFQEFSRQDPHLPILDRFLNSSKVFSRPATRFPYNPTFSVLISFQEPEVSLWRQLKNYSLSSQTCVL